VLQQYFRALADFFVRVKKYQQAFLVPLRGTVAVVVFEPGSPLYLLKKLLLFLPLPSAPLPCSISYPFGEEKRRAIGMEIARLLDAGFIKDVYHPE
jgi:hypothetical protein